jgi:glycosyltransferase involved in cell wall biosynthesis
MAAVDVLVPTYNRPQSMVMTLAGVAAQSLRDLHVVVADQGEEPARGPVADARVRVIEARGGSVEWHERSQVHGIAEQRDFLLGRATADAVLYLDDDVFMEPEVIERMLAALREEGCGFVGAFPTGLSFRDDVRPAQQHVEFWDRPVLPEQVEPGDAVWEARWQLHRAANAWHAAQRLPAGEVRRYKVAWVASCVMYDRRKLLDAGSFAFWRRLPRFHSGEEVLVQNLLQRRWGACALLPSGTYHAELPSTVLNDDGRVDGHALALLREMVARI